MSSVLYFISAIAFISCHNYFNQNFLEVSAGSPNEHLGDELHKSEVLVIVNTMCVVKTKNIYNRSQPRCTTLKTAQSMDNF